MCTGIEVKRILKVDISIMYEHFTVTITLILVL
jgi:hypothetical protein